MSEIKHGGCADCGSTSQEILISVPDFTRLVSRALCDECLLFLMIVRKAKEKKS